MSKFQANNVFLRIKSAKTCPLKNQPYAVIINIYLGSLSMKEQ